VVTLFWEYAAGMAPTKKKVKRVRRLSNPRPVPESLASLSVASDTEMLKAEGLDLEILSLKRRAAEAEAQVARLQEERKWAL
jgi:hypothetical protein